MRQRNEAEVRTPRESGIRNLLRGGIFVALGIAGPVAAYFAVTRFDAPPAATKLGGLFGLLGLRGLAYLITGVVELGLNAHVRVNSERGPQTSREQVGRVIVLLSYFVLVLGGIAYALYLVDPNLFDGPNYG